MPRGLSGLAMLLHRRVIILAGVTLTLIVVAWALAARPTEPIDSYMRCAEAGYPITDTDPPACTYGNHTFLGPRLHTATAPTPLVGTVQPFDILVDGDNAADYPRHQQHVNNELAWQRYWREVHEHTRPLPPLLPVNFITHDVIGLSLGQKPTGGYGLKVTAVTVSNKGSVIDVTESIPTVTCIVTDAVTNRYFIIRTPKLTPPVSFRITTSHRRCD